MHNYLPDFDISPYGDPYCAQHRPHLVSLSLIRGISAAQGSQKLSYMLLALTTAMTKLGLFVDHSDRRSTGYL